MPDVVDTVVCAPDNGWWYYPKHVGQFPNKINCVTLHLVGYRVYWNIVYWNIVYWNIVYWNIVYWNIVYWNIVYWNIVYWNIVYWNILSNVHPFGIFL